MAIFEFNKLVRSIYTLCYLRDPSGGLPFFKGNLYCILQNRIYIGDINHKDKSYPGEHKGIIDLDVFDRVQTIIAANRTKNSGALGAKYPSMLSGRLFDDQENYMVPKHSRTQDRHYRYYTSQAIMQGYAHKAGSLPNIPADEIEQLVRVEISGLLKDTKRLQTFLQNETPEQQKALTEKAVHLTYDNPDQERLFLRSIVHKVVLSDIQVKIDICMDHLAKALSGIMTGEVSSIKENHLPLICNMRLAATNSSHKMVIGSVTSGRNLQLIKAIVRSFLWNEQLLAGEKKTLKEIGEQDNIASTTYISRIIRLRFLAPDIIEAILDGEQATEWTIEKLFAIKSLDWQQQRKILEISSTI